MLLGEIHLIRKCVTVDWLGEGARKMYQSPWSCAPQSLVAQVELQLLLSLLPLAACENHIQSDTLPHSCFSLPPEARMSAPREEDK